VFLRCFISQDYIHSGVRGEVEWTKLKKIVWKMNKYGDMQVVLHLGLKNNRKTYWACTICMGLECQLAFIMLHNKLEVGIGNMRGSRQIITNPMSRQS
jgi:hypothetical protein